MAQPMQAIIVAKLFDRNRLIRVSDGVAAALAASLPWSTSATGILAALWLASVIPTLDGAGLRRMLATPAGGLPVLLWALGLAGMLWADVSLSERLAGLGSFHKLLFIPLLLFHFERSERGPWVLKSFLISCGALLILSWIAWFYPNLPGIKQGAFGVPVKDYISQAAMFAICIAIAIDLALDAWRKARLDIALAWLLMAVAWLANVLFIATSRTALVVIPVLFLLFAFKRIGWKGTVGALLALIVLAGAAWPFSKYLRIRISTIAEEMQTYGETGAETSIGLRLEFWKKSLRFVADAPVIGHGTGTIREQFRRAATDETSASALIAANPHNQTLAVAIQLGLVGTAALFAMWIAHLLLFRGNGLAAWVGLAVVVQNIVGSLFNSHLFDFTHGWGYVVGVGVAGGIMLRDASQHMLEANSSGGEAAARVPL